MKAKIPFLLALVPFLLLAPGVLGAAPSEAKHLAPLSSTPLADAAATALMKQLSERMGAVTAFEACFIQEHHLTLYLDVLTANGVCYFQAPDRFRWEILTPYHSIVVFNHDRAAKFEERDGSMVYVKSGAYDIIRGLMAQMTGWMRGDFTGDREAFTIRVFAGTAGYELELTPRGQEIKQYIQQIEVYLTKEPLQTARIVIREPEQDYLEITFCDVRENAALNPELFNLRKPLETSAPDEKH